jgi:serine/threonine-protein kinase
MGESDLETVRMVQSARVPSIRGINPAVPAELERVMLKALTEDPDARYQRARDFGAALNQLLFTMGRSVSSFDIAELVEPIRKEREHKRKLQKRQSIIGTLIDEAMLEFTSIDSGGERKSSTGASVVGSLPVELGGFNQPNDWGEDLGNLGLSAPRAREQSGDAFEIGNLAALEDDPLSGRVRSISSSPPSPDDSDPPPAATPEPPRQLSSLEPEPMPDMRASSKGGKVAALVVFVLLCAGAGAYFAGLIPH